MGWTTNQSLLRDRIIGKAQKGRWTAKVAEQVAGRLGVGPLASKPDLADYDPLQEPYWSILMTLAWIMWRDVGYVREYWDDWRTRCTDWCPLKTRIPNGTVEGSWNLEPNKPASLRLLHVEGGFDSPRIAFSIAENQLWKYLQLGRLTATGKEADSNRTGIPKESWQDLQLRDPGNQVQSASGEVWKEVTFASKDVLRLWLSQPTDAASPFDEPIDGWMYLGEVIYWVASEGHSFHPTDQSETEKGVFSAIDRRCLSVEGLNQANEPEAIPNSIFSNVTAFEPRGRRAFFSQIETTDDGTTRFGGELSLPGEYEPRWRRIRVRKDEVRKLWTFGPPHSEEARVVTKGPRKKERHRSPENEALLKSKYGSVLASGRRLREKFPNRGPDQLAAMMEKEKRLGLSTETVRKILSGRYKPMKRLRHKGIF